jgi:hypothetical protein
MNVERLVTPNDGVTHPTGVVDTLRNRENTLEQIDVNRKYIFEGKFIFYSDF